MQIVETFDDRFIHLDTRANTSVVRQTEKKTDKRTDGQTEMVKQYRAVHASAY